MKKISIIFLASVCLGALSSFAFSDDNIETDCYVIADIDNAEVIYIPDESINEVCNESCFSEMK